MVVTPIPRIAVDFDNTIYDGKNIIEGCIEAMTELRKHFRVAIFSARPTNAERIQMEAILRDNAVPYDEILGVKPEFEYIIDDKGIRFNGDWNEVMCLIERLNPVLHQAARH